MAVRLRGLLEKQFCEWSVGKTLTVLSACAILGLTIECEPGRAQVTANHPPVISTSSQWTLDAPILASTNASGVSGNSFSLHANFSPDGTHLLFWSGSTNLLVPAAAISNEQLYMKDLTTGVVYLVSGDTNGDPGNGTSLNPNNSCQVLMFSPDGTKVVFESAATNLVLGGTNGNAQIFIKDVTTGAVTLVSADVNGVQGNNSSQNFAFSLDGTKVTFASSATNLLASPTHTSDIFVKDLTTKAVTLVSADANGVEGNGVSSFPIFSPDGMKVAFVSTSTNLAPGATNGNSEIYVKNLVSGAVTLVSADANGVPGNSTSLLPMFSPDGSKVAFNSISTNLTQGSASGNSEIYVKDLATGAITLVSTDANGVAANSNDSMLAVFSPDGAKVAFESTATNLVPGSTSGKQVFVKDLLTGAVTLASSDAGGAQGNSDSSDPNFSPDHKALAFQSMASNLGVANGTFGILVRPIFTSSGAVVDNPSATTLKTAGQLSFSDLDVGDTHTASVAAQAGSLGTLVSSVSKDTTGTATGGVISWNYQVDEAQVHALSAAATDTFTLTLTDNQGCTATTAIVVTDLPHDFSVVSTSSGSTSTSISTSSCPTTTALVSSQNPSAFGQAVTFSVTVSSSAGTPTGTVTFVDGATSIGTGTLDSLGRAALSISSLAVGAHSITAKYNGNTPFAPSTSTVLTQTVNLPAATTYLNALVNPVAFGQALTLIASVQPPGSGSATGTVAFFDGGSSLGTAIVSSNAAQLSVSTLGVGSHTLTAKYSGDANFAGSTSAAVTETVSQAATTTTVSSNTNPAAFSQSVTFTASVSAAYGGAATGTVTFLDGTTSLGTAGVSNNNAQITLSTLSVGAHSITAKYSGDGNFTTSTSSGLSQTVNRATSTTTVTSGLNPATFGQSVTFSATVQSSASGTPTGTIALLDGTTSVATGSLASGTVQLTVTGLSGGSHPITAVYSGDANFAGSTSGALAETVNAAASSTALTSSSGTVTVGQTITLTATVQPSVGSMASGTVTFFDGTTAIGTATLASNSAQLSISTLTLGTHSITATYGGNGNLAASSSAAVVETITQASTTMTITSGLNPAPFGQAVQFTGTVQTPSSGAATGTITFFDGTTSLGTATVTNSGSQHNSVTLYYGTFTGGTHTITASYSGDANYAASTSAPLTETVTQASSTVSIASGLNPATFGQSVTLTATVRPSVSGSLASGSMNFLDGATSLGTVNLSNDSAQLTVSNLAPGSHSITANYNGDKDFSGSTSAVLTQTVNQAATTMAIASNLNPSAFGQSVTFTATVRPSTGTTATGTVTFMDGAASLGSTGLSSNSAQLTLSALAVGLHSITAVYAGSANLSGSTSAALTQTVNKASTTTTLSSLATSSTLNQALTFTATVNFVTPGAVPPSGTVTFVADGSNTLCASVPLQSNGIATCGTSTLSAGSHTITATYSGDTNFLSSSNSLTLSVVASGSADLAIKMRADDRHVSRGDSDTYTIRVTNKGPSIASAVVMIDVLPAGTVFRSAHASRGSCEVPAVGQPVICTTASLSRSWEISIKVKITAPRGSTIANTANVTSSTPDPNLLNNTSSVMIFVSRDHDGKDDGESRDNGDSRDQ